MRLMISVGLVILLSGCVGSTNYYTSTVNSWRGGNVQTLTQQWGSPDTKIVNPNGSMIYIYKTNSYSAGNTTGSPAVGVNVSRTGRAVITTPQGPGGLQSKPLSISCLAVFEADARGKIYNTEVRGKGCYGSSDLRNTMSNPRTVRSP